MNYEMLPLDYKKSFSRYTNLLKFIGIDIFGSINTNSKMRFLVFNVIFLPFLCVQFTLLFKINADNFLEGALLIPITVMFIKDILKMTTAIVRKSELKEILVEIGELWPTGLHDTDQKSVIMKNHMKHMGALVNAFFIYAIVNLTLFEVIPLLMTVYNVSISAEEEPVYKFPFEIIDLWTVNSTFSYVTSYIWELAAIGAEPANYISNSSFFGMVMFTAGDFSCIATPCQLCLYLPYDLLIITMTSNVSLLFRLLQVDLQTSIQSDGRMRHVGTMDLEYDKIVGIIKNHQKLLRISKQLSSIFGLVIFVHVGFSAVEICFFGFLTVVYGGLAETIANLLTVWNSVITIYLIALSGQLLCDTSSKVSDAAYQSAWYTSDIKVKKLILFIIIRSQKTSYLSALGFSNITLRSFSKIMSTAWTYFSLLVQMYEDK